MNARLVFEVTFTLLFLYTLRVFSLPVEVDSYHPFYIQLDDTLDPVDNADDSFLHPPLQTAPEATYHHDDTAPTLHLLSSYDDKGPVIVRDPIAEEGEQGEEDEDEYVFKDVIGQYDESQHHRTRRDAEPDPTPTAAGGADDAPDRMGYFNVKHNPQTNQHDFSVGFSGSFQGPHGHSNSFSNTQAGSFGQHGFSSTGSQSQSANFPGMGPGMPGHSISSAAANSQSAAFGHPRPPHYAPHGQHRPHPMFGGGASMSSANSAAHSVNFGKSMASPGSPHGMSFSNAMSNSQSSGMGAETMANANAVAGSMGEHGGSMASASGSAGNKYGPSMYDKPLHHLPDMHDKPMHHGQGMHDKPMHHGHGMHEKPMHHGQGMHDKPMQHGMHEKPIHHGQPIMHQGPGMHGPNMGENMPHHHPEHPDSKPVFMDGLNRPHPDEMPMPHPAGGSIVTGQGGIGPNSGIMTSGPGVGPNPGGLEGGTVPSEGGFMLDQAAVRKQQGVEKRFETDKNKTIVRSKLPWQTDDDDDEPFIFET